MITAQVEEPQAASPTSGHDCLLREIEHATHYLPAQGPITVFVHHNTLHAFEHLAFEEGVKVGGRLFGCHAFLPEDRYREKLQRGRIRVEDLEAVLIDDLGDEADRLVANFGTRYALRLAMLQFPLRFGPAAELRWVIAETDALRRFREEVDSSVRADMIDATRKWVTRKLQDETCRHNGDLVANVLEQFDRNSIDAWSDRTWEAFVLNFLWRVCQKGVHLAERKESSPQGPAAVVRHRDILFDATGEDSDLPVHEVLIRLCAGYLDQGIAEWELPDRDQGLFQSFLSLYGNPYAAPTSWHKAVRREVCRIKNSGMDARESIEVSLSLLGVAPEERESFITQSLLALRGWAGMVWQMESNAPWAPHPAPAGSLIDFLAIRMILDRVSIARVAKDHLGFDGPLDQVRQIATNRLPAAETNGCDGQAFTVFQIAQVRGWKPSNLLSLSSEQWTTLIDEIESFSAFERRRTYHLAFERKYRNETLNAVIAHQRNGQFKTDVADTRSEVRGDEQPAYQVACCIDEREESFRRHLEEVDPQCETLGIAGFFGVAMYYRGASDAHFKPLCPVSIQPAHYVVEEPLYSVVQAEQRRAKARKRLGSVTHRAHRGTRTMLGGMLTGFFGSLAAFPLVARILFPRTTAQIRRMFGEIIRTPPTELRLERIEETPGSGKDQIGYSVQEMARIVEGGLQAMGLVGRLSRLVVICGHGSASLNNPHEAAHDCGACGGGRGGPNARAFAQMANDHRVRKILADGGLVIASETFFVGGYHNTCDDSMIWYDLDHVPLSHRPLFERAKAAIDEARQRSAHERCRRFESTDLTGSPEDALRHVEGRAEDLSQTRPEYGHATNALCFVGRRSWSRGMFLDRRAFLTSYDPTQDDERSSILEGLLRAVIPVCAGINLEYYFSYVDPTGYGCGTKLPHNITSLIGVMDGASSDLRPGLPWQMVEIHEPVRLLFVIETTPAAMQRIIDENEAIARLVDGQWVQLAVYDAEANRIQRYTRGGFFGYEPDTDELPMVQSSVDWYGGHREHLGFASIQSGVEASS